MFVRYRRHLLQQSKENVTINLDCLLNNNNNDHTSLGFFNQDEKTTAEI